MKKLYIIFVVFSMLTTNAMGVVGPAVAAVFQEGSRNPDMATNLQENAVRSLEAAPDQLGRVAGVLENLTGGAGGGGGLPGLGGGGGGAGIGGVLSGILPGGSGGNRPSRADHERACDARPNDAFWNGRRCQCFNQNSRWNMNNNGTGACVVRRGNETDDIPPDAELLTAAGIRELDSIRQRPTGPELDFVTDFNIATTNFVNEIAGEPRISRRAARAQTQADRAGSQLGDLNTSHAAARRMAKHAEGAVLTTGILVREFSGDFTNMPSPAATLTILRGANNDARRALEETVRVANNAGTAIVRAENARSAVNSAVGRGQSLPNCGDDGRVATGRNTTPCTRVMTGSVREARNALRDANRAATNARNARNRAIDAAREYYFRARSEANEFIRKQRENLVNRVEGVQADARMAYDGTSEFMQYNRDDLPNNLRTDGDNLLAGTRNNRNSADRLQINDNTPATEFVALGDSVHTIDERNTDNLQRLRNIDEQLLEHLISQDEAAANRAEQTLPAEPVTEAPAPQPTAQPAAPPTAQSAPAAVSANPNDAAARQTIRDNINNLPAG